MLYPLATSRFLTCRSAACMCSVRAERRRAGVGMAFSDVGWECARPRVLLLLLIMRMAPAVRLLLTPFSLSQIDISWWLPLLRGSWTAGQHA